MSRVQEDAFDPGSELAEFAKSAGGSGAIVTFTGLVRDVTAGLEHLDIEHYPAMTQSAIETVEIQAVERWELDDCLIIHRFGRLKTGDTIMMVATAAPHRAAAFEAAEFLMDYLKSRAPFWKKEVTRSGAHWVDARSDDEEALKRW